MLTLASSRTPIILQPERVTIINNRELELVWIGSKEVETIVIEISEEVANKLIYLSAHDIALD